MSMSGEALQGPKELAKSYFFLASAGKSAEQSMALLPAVSKFATAGAFDMALATDLLTDAQSALGLASKNVVQDEENLIRVSDVLVKANTLANASVQQFSTAITSKAGAALKAFNKDIEEGTAVLAALADQGIKAELAGNALDRMIRLLSKSSLDNAKQHKILGFRFEARVQAVILPLLGTSEAIKKYERDLRRAQGITDEVAARQMKAFANQMTVLKNQVTILAIEIGETLAPALTTLAAYIKSGVKTWRSWSDGTKTIIVTIAALAAALGPLLIVLGFVASAVGNLITLYATLKTTTIGLTLASWGLKGSVLGVAGAIGVVALAVSAFVIAARVDLERLRAEADKSGDAFVRLADKRLKVTGATRAEGAKRLKDVEIARANLRRAGQQVPRPFAALGAAFGFDPTADARKQLAVAEEQLRKFQSFQGRARTTTREAEGKKSLLAEAEKQAKLDEKREQTQKRIEEETRSIIEALEMEIRVMRYGADAAQLWAMNQFGASEAAVRFTAELQRQKKALGDLEKAKKGRQEFLERGKRLTEEALTPVQRFDKRRRELVEQLRGGGIGRGTFARLIEQAMKDLAGALGGKGGGRAGSRPPSNVATRWGGPQMAVDWRANQRRIGGGIGRGARDPQTDRIISLLARIAAAVEAETGIKINAGALNS
jgi:hypothetical protein